MKVGDLVSLSSKGRALQMNWQLVECGGYGMVVGKHDSNIITVLWFKSDGTQHWTTINKARGFYRYELKKFKKV